MSKNNGKKNSHNGKGKGKGKNPSTGKAGGNPAIENESGATKPSGGNPPTEGTDGETSKMTGFNNPKWHDFNPALTKDTCSIPFNTILGVNKQFSWPSRLQDQTEAKEAFDNATAVQGDELYAPGVMSIEFIPSYGVSGDITSSLNIAAQNIFAFTRKDNSGRINYESSDQMSLFIAMDSIYFLTEFIKRAYGCARMYNTTNRFFPKTWLAAMNLDVQDAQQNAPLIRARLNALIAKAASISVPADFDMYSRHKMMCEAVYTDVESAQKSQTYIFVPRAVYKRNELTSDLIMTPLHCSSISDYLDVLEDLIESVLLSEDIAVMTGDIRKAWKDFHEMSFLTEDYIMPIVYDPGIRSMIENSRAYSIDLENEVTTGNFNYVQKSTMDLNSYIECKPRYVITAPNPVQALGEANEVLLNMHWKDVEPIDVMYATRLAATIDRIVAMDGADGNYNYVVHFSSTPAELITGYRIWTDPNATANTKPPKFTSAVIAIATVDPEDGNVVDSGAVKFLTDLGSFDWHPCIFMYTYEANVGFMMQGASVDLDNWTILSRDNLKLINEVDWLSLFKIPSFGNFKQ